MIICDFCDSPDVLWSYPASDFVLDGTPLASEGGWAARHECAALVEANDRDGLARRALASYPVSLREEAPPIMRALHDAFWNARLGNPVTAVAYAA